MLFFSIFTFRICWNLFFSIAENFSFVAYDYRRLKSNKLANGKLQVKWKRFRLHMLNDSRAIEIAFKSSMRLSEKSAVLTMIVCQSVYGLKLKRALIENHVTDLAYGLARCECTAARRAPSPPPQPHRCWLLHLGWADAPLKPADQTACDAPRPILNYNTYGNIGITIDTATIDCSFPIQSFLVSNTRNIGQPAIRELLPVLVTSVNNRSCHSPRARRP